MRLHNSQRRGFTIIEVVITIAAFAVLMLVILTLFDWQGGNYRQQVAIIRSTSASRSSMQALEPLLLQSHRILSSYTVNGTLYTTDSDTIVLQLPSYDSSNNNIVNTWDYAAVYTSGSELWITVEANAASERDTSTKRVTNLLNTFSVTYSNADLTQARWADVSLSSQISVRQLTFSSRAEQQFTLRNY
jgi:prepilin-type N-terminal cleavage/methylation domain-containing protein